jgi:peptidoglycan/LPS O-acetylase OafA/YrhL
LKAETTQHFDSIDLLRGLAAIVVAFFHFTDFFLPKTNLLNWSSHYGYLGVEAFFVISGMVVPLSLAQRGYSLQQFGGVLLKRIIRIEPAYWASIVLMLSKDTIISFYYTGHFPGHSNWNIFLHLFHANAICFEPWIRGIYWTLAIDWQFYLLVCLTFSFLNRREWWIRYPVYAAFAFAHFYGYYEWLPYHITPFGAGFLLFHYYRGYMDDKELAIALPAMLLMHYRGFDITHCLATTLSCGIILFIQKVPNLGKFLGKISYSFYLTHILTGWALLSGLSMQTDNEVVMTMAIFVAIAFSFFCAYFFYNVVEKPTLKWARKVKF